MVVDSEDGGFIFESNGAVRRTIPLGTQRLSGEVFEAKVTQSLDYLAIPRTAGGAMILDTATGAAWPVGETGVAPAPAITPDGTVLYELKDHVYGIWRLAIAHSRAETIALAATLTNAILTPSGDAVSWP